jgi:hypothetical protein
MIELKKAMEDGAISADMVTDAFKSATGAGGLFYGALDKGAATTEGKIAKLGDAILGLKVSFGTGFNEGLKSALDATNVFLPQLEGMFAQAGDFLGKALTEAVSGDYDKLAAIGVLAGTAFWEGFKEIGGNVIVETMRKWMDFTGEKAGMPEALRSALQTTVLGAKPTMGSMISNVRTGMQPAIEGAERASAPPTWAETLEKNRKLTEELVRQGKTTNEELRKAFGGKTSTTLFSR